MGGPSVRIADIASQLRRTRLFQLSFPGARLATPAPSARAFARWGWRGCARKPIVTPSLHALRVKWTYDHVAAFPTRRLATPARKGIGAMSNDFFERPILNSPYGYPRRHWELDSSGQPTQRIIESRRRAAFLSPIPKPMKHSRRAVWVGVQSPR